MRAKMVLPLLVMAASLSLAESVAGAEEPPAKSTTCPICRQANNQQAPYAEKAGSTLVRGALNTAFGWTEMLVQPAEEVNRGGNVLSGVGKGIGLAVKRTALGFGELLTFWTPKGKEGNVVLTRDCPVCFSSQQSGKPGAQSPPPSAPSKPHPR